MCILSKRYANQRTSQCSFHLKAYHPLFGEHITLIEQKDTKTYVRQPSTIDYEMTSWLRKSFIMHFVSDIVSAYQTFNEIPMHMYAHLIPVVRLIEIVKCEKPMHRYTFRMKDKPSWNIARTTNISHWNLSKKIKHGSGSCIRYSTDRQTNRYVTYRGWKSLCLMLNAHDSKWFLILLHSNEHWTYSYVPSDPI